MFAKTYGATTLGVDGVLIDVEVDTSFGLPGFDIVGLPDTSVREAKERVRTAIKNSGIRLKQEKVTINLAPADIRKDSSGLDLPIAIGLLTAYGILPQTALKGCLFAAELSLEGALRRIHGILPMAVHAREHGFTTLFVAEDNVNEALLVEGLTVYGMKNLADLVDFLLKKKEFMPARAEEGQLQNTVDGFEDFSDVQGQFVAKRALEIAAAGGHNVLLVGVPGSGKTMLARRMPSILPDMLQQEALEVTKIYSIAGLLHQKVQRLAQAHVGVRAQRDHAGKAHAVVAGPVQDGRGECPRLAHQRQRAIAGQRAGRAGIELQVRALEPE